MNWVEVLLFGGAFELFCFLFVQVVLVVWWALDRVPFAEALNLISERLVQNSFFFLFEAVQITRKTASAQMAQGSCGRHPVHNHRVQVTCGAWQRQATPRTRLVHNSCQGRLGEDWVQG